MDQIKTTLKLICYRLNEFFRDLGGQSEDVVVLSNVVDHEGREIAATRNRLVMFLANIQHETTISTYNRTTPLDDNAHGVVSKPLYINLYVLFYANFYDSSYVEGLGVISRTISFLQQNPSFNHENMPNLPEGVDKLTFELTNLDLTELNYLMGLLGTKYLPSVYYKIRMLPFAGDIRGEVPAVRSIAAPGEPKSPEQRGATGNRAAENLREGRS